MSTNLEGIVARIRDVRARKRPETEQKLRKTEALLAALRDTREKASAVAARHPELAAALQGVSFNGAENRLVEARTLCETALTRLRRESINIAVAGKARQGKSQILQKLTGLGDLQIPTGDGGFCTASRSIIHNGDTPSATVHYLTEVEMLNRKVYPSFAPVGTEWGVGLDWRPATLSAFIDADLPTSQEVKARGATSTAMDYWTKVLALQGDLRDGRLRSLLGTPPERLTDMNAIRDYLVKDGGQTTYQTVDYVEIVTPFPDELPMGMTVYDIPGLDDPTPGIRETMLKSVSEDADIVFFIRLPASTGDAWFGVDETALDLLRGIYPTDEVDINDWVQVVLNHWPEKDNLKNAESLKAAAKEKWGLEAVICNCGSEEEVRQMVDDNIEALVKQAGRLDDLRIRQADEAFAAALKATRALLEALRNATGDVLAQESGFDIRLRFKRFMRDLRVPFREKRDPEFRDEVQDEIRNILSRHFEMLERRLNELYEANDQADAFPDELPVFSRERLSDEFGGGEGSDMAVDIAVRNQGAAVLKLIRERLTECCREMVERYYECVLETGFKPNAALNRISSVDGENASARARLERFREAIGDTGPYPSLETALEDLLRFELTFDATILPVVYAIPDFDDFNPDRKGADELNDVKRYLREQLGTAKERADALFDWLRQKSEGIVAEIASDSESSPLERIAGHVGNMMGANYDAFVFRLIWGDTCWAEWERFADRHKSVFWKDEFDEAMANSQLAKDWGAALAGLAAAL